MTDFKKVTPALKIVTPCRSIIEANRPAWGNTGDPSAMMLVTRVSNAAEIVRAFPRVWDWWVARFGGGGGESLLYRTHLVARSSPERE